MKPHPSSQSIKGLNGLLFCISDIRHGIGPLLAMHLRNTLQWNSGRIGIALAAVEFSSLICQIPAGLIADETRKKRSLIALSLLFIISGCLLFLFFSSFSMILFAQLLMGISVAFILPALGGITLGLVGRKKFPARAAKKKFGII